MFDIISGLTQYEKSLIVAIVGVFLFTLIALLVVCAKDKKGISSQTVLDNGVLKGIVISNVGRVRTNNEDNYNLFGEFRSDVNRNDSIVLKDAPIGQSLAAVFDGMGGEESGEIASLIAAQSVESIPIDKGEITKQIIGLNELICDEIKRRSVSRMGTTFAGLYFYNGRVLSVNVGDSRCYLLRDKKLFLLSHDHSQAQYHIDKGRITEEEARSGKMWHVLTQCLGVFPDEMQITPFFGKEEVIRIGDRFLICSDGLTDLVWDNDIESLLASEDLKETAENLISTALNRGGKDNVTVAVIDVRSA